ncbi:hypothetical protein HC776_03845 [bacterium]|nr:hypothetical protein [bacterium]
MPCSITAARPPCFTWSRTIGFAAGFFQGADNDRLGEIGVEPAFKPGVAGGEVVALGGKVEARRGVVRVDFDFGSGSCCFIFAKLAKPRMNPVAGYAKNSQH